MTACRHPFRVASRRKADRSYVGETTDTVGFGPAKVAVVPICGVGLEALRVPCPETPHRPLEGQG